MKLSTFIFFLVFYSNFSDALSPNIKSEAKSITFNTDNTLENKNSNTHLTLHEKEIYERNRKIEKIIQEVEDEFSNKKYDSKSNVKVPDLLRYYNKHLGAYAKIKRRWNGYKFPIGDKIKEISLPNYLQNIEKMVTTFETDNNVTVSKIVEPETFAASYSSNVKSTSSSECDVEYGNNLLKRFIDKICKRIDKKQKAILSKISMTIRQINSGSVEAVFVLLNCLQELEDDTFDILKQILVIIDKLVEIKQDAVKLVIEMVIDSLGNVIKGWEEKKCGCDCPGFLHSSLKYIIDIITWTPKKKIKQLIEHIIDIFTSVPWLRCTCACEGFFALSVEESSIGQLRSEEQQLSKREQAIESTSNSSIADLSILSVDKSKRKDIRRQKVGNSRILQKVDQILIGKIKHKEMREQQNDSIIKKKESAHLEDNDIQNSQGMTSNQERKPIQSVKSGQDIRRYQNPIHRSRGSHNYAFYKGVNFQDKRVPEADYSSYKNDNGEYQVNQPRIKAPSNDYVQHEYRYNTGSLINRKQPTTKNKATKRARMMQYQE